MLVMVVAIVGGILGFVLTPKQYNPEIIRPAFIVEIAYPGGTVDEGFTLVATELVDKVTALDGVDEVTVQVHDGAHIAAVVIFDVGFSKDTAKVSLQTQLAQHSYLAQGTIQQPSLRELNPDEVPVLTVRLTSDRLPLTEVRSQALRLSHILTNVQDVASAEVHGGYTPALVVEVLPDELARTQLSTSDVLRVVEQASNEYPLIALHDGSRRIVVDIENSSVSPDTLAEVGLTDTVRLGDVARIYRGTEEVESYVLHQAHGGAIEDAVLMSFAKREGASAPVVTQAIREELDMLLKQERFADVSYVVVNDDGVMASAEITGLMKNLLTSILIVAAILVLFLSQRSALVVGLSIPFTMLIVFALGYLFGETINRITLFALILSLGLLVDAAIVVVEAVYARARTVQTLQERVHTVVDAVNSVGVGLFLSMLTSIVVFMPMNYITGMMGPYMGPISFFVPAALVVSFLVAVTVMPYLALVLIRHEQTPGLAARIGSWLMSAVSSRYEKTLTWLRATRRNQRTVLVGAGVLFVVALLIPVAEMVHFQMLPKADRDQYFIQLDMPAGTDVVRTRMAAEQLAALAQQDSQVRSVQLFVAEPQVLDFNGMFKGAHLRTQPHQATLRVNLTPHTTRSESSTDIVETARARFLASAASASVETVKFIEDPPGPPVLATFVAEVSSADERLRDQATRDLDTLVRTTRGVVDVDTSIENPYARLTLTVDHAAARAYGVTVSAIYDALLLVGAPQQAGQHHADGYVEFAPVEVRMPRGVYQNTGDLSVITVRSATGSAIPLESLVHLEYVPSREPIRSEGTVVTRYITAETEGRPIVYVMLDVMKALRKDGLGNLTVESWNLFGMTLVSEEGVEVQLTWGGEWEMTLENFRDLGLAMMAALFLVYTILVAQYHNFKTPGLILITVPLGLVGILAGFSILDVVADIPLTATALIGFIALIGIVVNNAIILLERFEQAQADGMEYEDALVDAATSRLRPILLTSLTTVLGSLTIAFDPVWSGLAWAIVFGLSLSTVLTLVILPSMLLYTRREEL